MSEVENSNTVVHYYRAAVGHADIWRQRLDSTTNWAIVTNAGIISFSFNSPASIHFILLFLLVIDLFFLLMEARRYQDYDVWQVRLRALERYVFAPAFSGGRESDPAIRAGLDQLAEDLGRTVPRLSLLDAVGYRLRRNYVYIMAITLAAWWLKIWIHPVPADSIRALVRRAEVGFVAGHIVVLVVLVTVAAVIFLVLRAPSERMVAWTPRPAPLTRLMEMPWFKRPRATAGRKEPFPLP